MGGVEWQPGEKKGEVEYHLEKGSEVECKQEEWASWAKDRDGTRKDRLDEGGRRKESSHLQLLARRELAISNTSQTPFGHVFSKGTEFGLQESFSVSLYTCPTSPELVVEFYFLLPRYRT